MDHDHQDNSDKKNTIKTDQKNAGNHHMPLPHRSFVTGDSNAEDKSAPAGSDDVPESRSSILPPAKHNVIKPPDDFKMDSPDEEEEKPAPQKVMDVAAPVKKESAVDAADAKPESEDSAPAMDFNKLPEDGKEKPSANVEADIKRQQEIEDVIDSHKYFVPVDRVIKRRAIKVNLSLTLVVFLLAIVLIDLMLDSGAIILLQKVPHTHFFSVSKDSN